MGGITRQVLGSGLAVIPMIKEAFANGADGKPTPTRSTTQEPNQ
jgi:hypothetical protein